MISRRTPKAPPGENRGRRWVRPSPGATLPTARPSRSAIDGKLDEQAWKAAPWTDAFVDIEGDVEARARGSGPGPRCSGTTRTSTSPPELEEPHVWGTLTKHDSVIFHDNDFEVFIDPDGDNHEYYEIEINALNTEWDLFLKKPYRDGGPAINEWEIPGLKTAVARRRHAQRPERHGPGLVGRARDPLEGPGRVRPPPSPRRRTATSGGSTSRGSSGSTTSRTASTARCPSTREDNWVWSPQGVVDMHRPERWGFVQFSTAPGAVSLPPRPRRPAATA